MVNFKIFLHIYSFGAIGYCFIETLWRGYTHWSMGILGGICFILMYQFERRFKKLNMLIKAVILAIIITMFELLTGIIVNLIFELNVWDYSDLKYNFMGQISLIYSVFWFVLCIPCILLCRILKHRVFDVLTWVKSQS